MNSLIYKTRKVSKANVRVYPHKNSDVEIHMYRKNGDDITLIPICMALHQRNEQDISSF